MKCIYLTDGILVLFSHSGVKLSLECGGWAKSNLDLCDALGPERMPAMGYTQYKAGPVGDWTLEPHNGNKSPSLFITC